jgi:hypothetical protein
MLKKVKKLSAKCFLIKISKIQYYVLHNTF